MYTVKFNFKYFVGIHVTRMCGTKSHFLRSRLKLSPPCSRRKNGLSLNSGACCDWSIYRAVLPHTGRPVESEVVFVATLTNIHSNRAKLVKLLVFIRLIRLLWIKVAGYSFQYISRLRVWWVIITILYRLTPKSWYQQTAQSPGNKLLLILWHNRLP